MRFEPTVTVACPRSYPCQAVVRFHCADLSYDQWQEVAQIASEYFRQRVDRAVPLLEARLRAWLHQQVVTDQLHFDYTTKRWVADGPIYDEPPVSQSSLP